MLANVLTFFLMLLTVQEFCNASRSKRGIPFVEKCPKTWNHPKCHCETSETTAAVTIQCDHITDPSELESAFSHDWEVNNKHFEWFTMRDAVLTSLPDGVFKNATFLGFIMTNNTIGKISDHVFQGSAESAEYFWMTDSNLADFNFNVFLDLKQLTSVAITSSGLTQVPGNAFGQLNMLDTISLENNAIDQLGLNAFGSLPRLRNLNLSGNKLTEVKNGQLKLQTEKNPVVINLANNKIASIETGAFSNFKEVPSELNLERNNLQTLEEDVFSPLLVRMKSMRKAALKLRGNPFICSKHSMDWILQRSSQYMKIIRGLECVDRRSPLDNEGQ